MEIVYRQLQTEFEMCVTLLWQQVCMFSNRIFRDFLRTLSKCEDGFAETALQ